jgi:TRAP-type C4-dicarboxylate transport system substrate-binding protein
MKISRLLVALLALVLILVPLVAVACGEGDSTETTSAPTETTAGGTETTAAPTETTAAPTETTAAPSGETIELSLASLYPATAPPAQSLQRWADKIAADSGGRLTIRHYSDSTLIAAPDMRTGVDAGTADLGSSFIYKPEPGFEPSMVMSQLILGLDYENCLKIFDDMWNEFPDLWNGQWEKFKVIWVTVIDPNLLVTTEKAVRTLDDIKGQQIRMPSKWAGEMLKNLGAAPVEMPTADWVVSLDKHTTDGAVTSVGSVLDHQVGEKLKYCTRYSTGPGVTFLIMNKQKYESLPADLQKVIDDNMEFGLQDFVQAKKDSEIEAIAYMEQSGVEFIDLTPEEYAKWDAAVQPVFDQIAKELNDAGHPGTELVEFALERAKFYQSQ